MSYVVIDTLTDKRLSCVKKGFKVVVTGPFGSIEAKEYAQLESSCKSLFGPAFGKVFKKRVYYYCSQPNQNWYENGKNIFFKNINDARIALEKSNLTFKEY